MMKCSRFSIAHAIFVVVTTLFIAGCNGDKFDADLIDSRTGKVSVEKITIDQADFEMTEGESTVLTATVLPADATDKTVSWHSSKEDVVMISNTGKAMAIAPGKSIITAKAGSKTDFITITVIANAVRVTGISLEKTTLELKMGDSEMLIATVTPDNATNQNVSWTSSDPAVATVENGRVTGVKPGSVTITAKTEDGGMTAECVVTVKTNLAPSVTVGAEHISAVSVVMKGEANLDAQMSSDMTMGIMWSENSGVLPSNSTKIEAKNIEAKEGSTTSYCYSVNLTGLDPEKTYYFRSYVTQNSQDTYGETMSFTTKELSSMIHTEDASNVSAVSAVMNATYDFTDVQYTNKTIGLHCGTTAETLSETYVAETSSQRGIISEVVTLLEPEQTYYYQSYIILDGKEYKESIRTFTTKVLSSMIHTEEASNISAVSAVLNAAYDLTNVQYSNKTIGLFYGTSANNLSKTYVAEITSAAGEISENWLVLKPSTEYFYQVYANLDNKLYKGGIKSFTTNELSSMLETREASDITPTSAKMNAKLDLTEVQRSAMEYGFYWGTSEDTTYVKGGKIEENAYSALLSGLSHKTQYWYKSSVKIDGQTFYGEIQTFTTDVVPVTSVSLNKTQYTFNTIGNTLTLTPSVLPSDATNKAVSWKSSNTSVATVDTNGKVTAKGNGAATITVTTKDQSKTATCEITVAQWVTGITMNKTSLTLNEGQTTMLTPTISPSTANDKSVTWSSSKTSVATVDQSGRVIAVSKGSATIKATANDGSGKYASCSVTVNRLVTSIDFDMPLIVLYNGERATITATVLPETATNRNLRWASSNTSVASVSSSGVVTGVARGTTMITATAQDGSGISKSCQVEVKQYVTGITMDKTSLTLNEGQTMMLTPTISPSNANDKSVTWSSGNTSVAIVDQYGFVTGVSKGITTIVATANDGSRKSASCSVTVNRLVSSIDLDKTLMVLYNGETTAITATVLPESANNRNLNWSSSNTSVATVSSSGVVTGVARGTATITAAAQDSSRISKTCQVEVKQYVTGITLENSSLALSEGQTMTLTPTISPSNANDKSVTWSSSNPSVATVDQNGQVTAVSKGVTTIMAVSNDGSGKSASCSVTVNRLVSSIDLDKTSIILYNGENTTITATVLPETATNRNLNWSSSNTSVATVDQSGKIAGIKRGTATITATAQDGSGISKTCEVEVKQYVTAISLSEISLSLNEGQSSTLSVSSITPDNANDKSVNWSSSNTSVATVSQNGEVVGVSKGAATITATANDGSGKSASCSVTIKRLVSSVEFNKTEITLYNGKDETLIATVSPPTANETGLIWSSSNSTIATVDQSGKITGVERGTATITAMAVDGSGKSASCQVEVKQYVTDITLDKSSVTLIEGQITTLTPTISPSNANDKSVSWSSDNTSVAIVDQNGNVTGVSAGATTVKAAANDGSGRSASCTVEIGQNLSASGSSNCYIVSSTGAYFFRTTKGKSSTSVGSVSTVEVLWESYGTSTVPSVGSVINNVSYANNTIYFSTPSTLNNGNAVIAAKDTGGEILWSWHIWVCDGYNPKTTAQVYNNNAGTMMDRNLGATSATPGDVGALGLLYQWGRKDPFLAGRTLFSASKAASTLTWPSAASSNSSSGTIAYAVAHPTTFITCNTSNGDWYYTGSSSTDNSRWGYYKTIYDPCPPGWRVPDGGSSGVWEKAKVSSRSSTWDSTHYGRNFSGIFGSASTIWYPAAGQLDPYDFKLTFDGDTGLWWSCSKPSGESRAYYLSSSKGYIYTSELSARAYGYSVRCQKE